MHIYNTQGHYLVQTFLTHDLPKGKFSSFYCEDLTKGIAVLVKTAKREQELPSTSQEAAAKVVINAPETSQCGQWGVSARHTLLEGVTSLS